MPKKKEKNIESFTILNNAEWMQIKVQCLEKFIRGLGYDIKEELNELGKVKCVNIVVSMELPGDWGDENGK